MMINTKQIPALLFVVALAATAGGCKEYIDQRETVSFTAGDSMAHNRAVHVVDPWPSRSFDTNLPANGPRMQSAVQNYRSRRPAPASAQTNQTRVGVNVR